NSYNPSLFRLDQHQRAWKTVFYNEHSIDAGGPYRESIQWMCNELQSSDNNLNLFKLCANALNDNGKNRDKFIPNIENNNIIHNNKYIYNLYFFLGKLIGLAIRTKELLSLNFPNII